MHIQIPHKFTQPQAVDRVKKGLMQAKPQLQGQVKIDKEEWQDNMLTFAFTTQGKQVTGTLKILKDEFIIDAKLPLLWRMFEGKIQKAIEEQIKALS